MGVDLSKEKKFSNPIPIKEIFKAEDGRKRRYAGPNNAKAAGPSGVKISEVEEEEEEHVEAAEKGRK
ncbi:hypothetical protein GH714_036183 [Hevea brasiliensis]|uniref:Uncharacterized protein n=1 Tax=Hevea brasiliensis TaxID=3981 RepID=A0A6A6KF78_HEVBR|nr:hypothetical protein GH714_036183 [Hevea brasiliensis]